MRAWKVFPRTLKGGPKGPPLAVTTKVLRVLCYQVLPVLQPPFPAVVQVRV